MDNRYLMLTVFDVYNVFGTPISNLFHDFFEDQIGDPDSVSSCVNCFYLHLLRYPIEDLIFVEHANKF